MKVTHSCTFIQKTFYPFNYHIKVFTQFLFDLIIELKFQLFEKWVRFDIASQNKMLQFYDKWFNIFINKQDYDFYLND
jgi:hypothetical protein